MGIPTTPKPLRKKSVFQLTNEQWALVLYLLEINVDHCLVNSSNALVVVGDFYMKHSPEMTQM